MTDMFLLWVNYKGSLIKEKDVNQKFQHQKSKLIINSSL